MAKLFNFSLQKVLDIRSYKEEEKSIDLGKAQSALNFEKIKLTRLHDDKDTILSSSKKVFTDQPDLTTIRVRGSYMRQLSDEIENQKVEVSKNTVNVNKRRDGSY